MGSRVFQKIISHQQGFYYIHGLPNGTMTSYGLTLCPKHQAFLNTLLMPSTVRLQSTASTVTLENILSEANKTRVQSKLLDVNPVRKVPHWAKGKEHTMKKAAVLVPLCTVNGEPSVLFTVRSSDLTHHKGEVRYENVCAISFIYLGHSQW